MVVRVIRDREAGPIHHPPQVGVLVRLPADREPRCVDLIGLEDAEVVDDGVIGEAVVHGDRDLGIGPRPRADDRRHGAGRWQASIRIQGRRRHRHLDRCRSGRARAARRGGGDQLRHWQRRCRVGSRRQWRAGGRCLDRRHREFGGRGRRGRQDGERGTAGQAGNDDHAEGRQSDPASFVHRSHSAVPWSRSRRNRRLSLASIGWPDWGRCAGLSAG